MLRIRIHRIMIYVIIKDNYVVNRIVSDSVPVDYPFPHDKIIEDIDQCLFIGDWYEESEDFFYRPIGIPADLPDELKPIQPDQQ